MKLVQFLRPLFLVALGLHGLLLFIPIGESEPAVIEDIALEERPELDVDLPLTPPTPSSLPVPDLNVSSRTVPAGATAKPTQTRVAAARAAVTPARQTTSRARPPVALRGAPNTANTDEDTSDNNTNRATNTDSSESSQANTSAANNNQQTAADASRLPDLSEQQTEDSNRSEDNASAAAGDTASGSRLSKLASGVTRDFSDAVASLEVLVAVFDKSLTYNEAKTTDESAKRSRAQWTANLQQQANASSLESTDINEVSDAFQINYPIHVSENLLLEDDLKERLSGREISVCLEEDPSNAEVGIFFNAQGDPADEPTILRSTGYMLLDEEIKATVMASESLQPGSPLASALSRRSSAYVLEVGVNYDKQSCVSLSDLQGQSE